MKSRRVLKVEMLPHLKLQFILIADEDRNVRKRSVRLNVIVPELLFGWCSSKEKMITPDNTVTDWPADHLLQCISDTIPIMIKMPLFRFDNERFMFKGRKIFSLMLFLAEDVSCGVSAEL